MELICCLSNLQKCTKLECLAINQGDRMKSQSTLGKLEVWSERKNICNRKQCCLLHLGRKKCRPHVQDGTFMAWKQYIFEGHSDNNMNTRQQCEAVARRPNVVRKSIVLTICEVSVLYTTTFRKFTKKHEFSAHSHCFSILKGHAANMPRDKLVSRRHGQSYIALILF